MRTDRAKALIELAAALCFLVALSGLTAAAPPPSPNDVVWVWSGAVTTSSAVVKAKLVPGVRKAKLIVNPSSAPEERTMVPANGYWEADPNGVIAFTIHGLQSGREYRYVVGTEGGSGPSGRFHTFETGPMSFRIGFASCGSTGSNHPIFDTLRKLNPLLFIHMGDLHYEDIEANDPSAFRRAYDRVLTSPRQGAFYRSTPVAFVWDDHDFGPNDADGTSASKPAALETFQQNVPHYPLFPVDGEVKAIQQAFTVGRVRFLMTDSRAERVPEDEPDGPGKTMLGKEQLEWLLRELRAAGDDYLLVVWVNGVPWITKSQPRKDHGWEPNSHERTIIADTIKELGLVNRFLMLSGDGHMVAIDDGTHSNYASDAAPREPAFPVVHAAPLDRFPRIKGGPYSHGAVAPKKLFPLLKAKQFGWMEVEDDGRRARIELTGRDSKGTILKGMVLRMECDPDGCEVVR